MVVSKVWIQIGRNRNSLRTELLCKENKKEMEKEREIQESQWVGEWMGEWEGECPTSQQGQMVLKPDFLQGFVWTFLPFPLQCWVEAK